MYIALSNIFLETDIPLRNIAKKEKNFHKLALSLITILNCTEEQC